MWGLAHQTLTTVVAVTGDLQRVRALGQQGSWPAAPLAIGGEAGPGFLGPKAGPAHLCTDASLETPTSDVPYQARVIRAMVACVWGWWWG